MIIHIDSATEAASVDVTFSTAAGPGRGVWRGTMAPPVNTDVDVELEFPETFDWGTNIHLAEEAGLTDPQVSEDPSPVVGRVTSVGLDGTIAIDLQGSPALVSTHGWPEDLQVGAIIRFFPKIVEIYPTNI